MQHVPAVRLTRLLYALPKQHESMTRLERSQAVPFITSRLVRVLHFFFWVTHVLGCVLHAFTTARGAEHYATAPWHEAGGQSFSSTTSSYVPQVLRSHYWSMMTLTTTGHVDIINSDGNGSGTDGEVLSAVVVRSAV